MFHQTTFSNQLKQLVERFPCFRLNIFQLCLGSFINAIHFSPRRIPLKRFTNWLAPISHFNLLCDYPILLKSPHCIIKAKWVSPIYLAGWSRTEKLNQHPSGDPVVWRVRRGEGVPTNQHPVLIPIRVELR
jgi:hypothetical protein